MKFYAVAGMARVGDSYKVFATTVTASNEEDATDIAIAQCKRTFKTGTGHQVSLSEFTLVNG